MLDPQLSFTSSFMPSLASFSALWMTPRNLSYDVYSEFQAMHLYRVSILLSCALLAFVSPIEAQGDGGGGGGGGGHGHVHVKVFRGPTQGRPGQEFASWGYHAYLPPDEHPRHYHK